MFKNLKIRDKLFSAFGIVILLFVVCAGIFFLAINGTTGNFSTFHDKAISISEETYTLKSEIDDLSISIGKTVMAPKKDIAETYIAETESKLAVVNEHISSLREKSFSDKYTAKLDELQAMIDEISKKTDKLFELCKLEQTKTAARNYYDNFNDLLVQISKVTGDLNDLAKENSDVIFVETLSMAQKSKTFLSIVCIITFITTIGVALAITKILVTPIRQLEEVTKALAQGKLKGAADIVTYQSRDELGHLADEMRFSMETIDGYVTEISALLEQLASGDLTIPLNEVTDYLGDFASIKESMATILKSFNTTISDIYTASMQVDVGSEQVSSGAQALSQGATEQASAVEELSATIAEVASHVSANAENAANASKMSNEAGAGVVESNKYMQQLMDAMEEINRTTGQIEKIIKTIEDIAFQTNILALNAAVEAARAGAAGKGFAVVADEVRSLAAKSAEAAKNTNNLIGSTVGAVRNGMNVASETEKALREVVVKAGAVDEKIREIATLSKEQAEKIEQIGNGIEQIAAVVHNNSATAEQSAAASEELASQAALMKDQISKFKLYDGSLYEQPVAEEEFAPVYESFEDTESFDRVKTFEKPEVFENEYVPSGDKY